LVREPKPRTLTRVWCCCCCWCWTLLRILITAGTRLGPPSRQTRARGSACLF
jgi:hypothetical protein